MQNHQSLHEKKRGTSMASIKENYLVAQSGGPTSVIPLFSGVIIYNKDC